MLLTSVIQYYNTFEIQVIKFLSECMYVFRILSRVYCTIGKRKECRAAQARLNTHQENHAGQYGQENRL